MISNNVLISIIVPCYNAEKYLDGCLNSLVNQTYKNLEIIVVNDGSTDKSEEIIGKYANIDRRIRYIKQKNSGSDKAKNAGIDAATGDYICFVDSDDFVEKQMYEIMVNSMIKTNTEMCICDYGKNKSEFDINKEIKYEVFSKKELMKGIFEDEVITSHLWRKTYPKKVFKEYRFSNRKVVHDMTLDYLLLYEVDNAVHIDAPLYIYRLDNETNMSARNAKKLESSLCRAQVMMERIDFAEKHYPEFVDIIVPKATDFLMSTYAKLILFYKDDKKDMEFVKTSIKKIIKDINASSKVPFLYKIVINAINKNLKAIPYLASKYYIHTLVK